MTADEARIAGETQAASDPQASDARAISHRKRWLFRSVAAGIPTLIGAALLTFVLIKTERLVRDTDTGAWHLQRRPIYVQEPGYEFTGHKYLYDAKLGWRNIPGWSATTHGFPLTINSKGLRGRECSYEKPAGSKRILVLGDSYAWGYGVADGEVFSEILQHDLQTQHLPWEVLNAGVSGWGTDQEYLYLVDEGFKYSPDIVVLAYFIVNDPDNVSVSTQYGLSKPVFLDTQLTLANVPVPRPGVQAPVQTTASNPLTLSIAILEAMQKACAEHHCRFVIMKFGEFLMPDNPAMKSLSTRIEHVAESHPGTYFLDLDIAYAARRITPPQLLEGNDDGHWNAFGHRVSAEILRDFLAREELLATGSQTPAAE